MEAPGAKRVGLLLASLSMAGGGALLVLEPEAFPTDALLAHAGNPAPCREGLLFARDGVPGAWTFHLVAGGSVPLQGLRYDFVAPGTHLLADAGGTFEAAAAPGGAGGVRYLDLAGSPASLDPGDQLASAAEAARDLEVRDPLGHLLGGSWGCA